MATKINVRSPFFTQTEFNSTLYQADLNLYVYDGTKETDKGTAKYTLSKTNAINYDISGFSYKGISFEISELVRDYIDVTFDGNYNSYNKWVRAEQFFYATDTIVTGTSQSAGAFELRDSSANFSRTIVGKYVRKEITGELTQITSWIDSTTIYLDDDIS